MEFSYRTRAVIAYASLFAIGVIHAELFTANEDIRDWTIPEAKVLKIPVTIEATTSAEPWAAKTNVPWINIETSSGTTPSTSMLLVDVDSLNQMSSNEAKLTITGDSNTITLAIQISVNHQEFISMASLAGSNKVFALTEGAAKNGITHQWLLEIDAEAETVLSAKEVREFLPQSDQLLIHPEDQNLYLCNRGSSEFATFMTNPFTYSRTQNLDDISGPAIQRMTPAGPGRLVITPSGNGKTVLLDLDAWKILAINNRGGNQSTFRPLFDPSRNVIWSSHAVDGSLTLTPWDLNDGLFTIGTNVYIDDPLIQPGVPFAQSPDGSVYYASNITFDKDFAITGIFPEVILAASPSCSIIATKSSIMDWPSGDKLYVFPRSDYSSFTINEYSKKLVLSQSGIIQFFDLSAISGDDVLAPTITKVTAEDDHIQLEWNKSLYNNTELEYREKDAVTWKSIDLSTQYDQSVRIILEDLIPATTYDIRIRGTAFQGTSAWNQFEIKTGFTPPHIGSDSQWWNKIKLNLIIPDIADEALLERSSPTEPWAEIARSSRPFEYYYTDDISIQPNTVYNYRLSYRKGDEWSSVTMKSFTSKPLPLPAAAPKASTHRIDSSSVKVEWLKGSGFNSSYEIQVGLAGTEEATWTTAAIVNEPNASSTIGGLLPNSSYEFRVRSLNPGGYSTFSLPVTAVTHVYLEVHSSNLEDDIEETFWNRLIGGIAFEGSEGFDTGKALWFNVPFPEAETLPFDLSKGGLLQFDMRIGRLGDPADWAPFLDGSTTIQVFWSKEDSGEKGLLLNLDSRDFERSWHTYAIELPPEAHTKRTSFFFRLLSSGTSGNWALDNIKVMTVVPQNAQEAWRFEHYAQTGNTGRANDQFKPLAGIPNLVFYALGLSPDNINHVFDPSAPTEAGWPLIISNAGTSQWTFLQRRSTEAASLNLEFNVSEDLKNWQTLKADSITPLTDSTLDRVEFSYPHSETDSIFYFIKVNELE